MKLKNAYGKYWEQCKNYVESDGYIRVGTFHNNEAIDFEMFEIELESKFENVPFGYFSELREWVRPKSISNCENKIKELAPEMLEMLIKLSNSISELIDQHDGLEQEYVEIIELIKWLSE